MLRWLGRHIEQYRSSYLPGLFRNSNQLDDLEHFCCIEHKHHGVDRSDHSNVDVRGTGHRHNGSHTRAAGDHGSP